MKKLKENKLSEFNIYDVDGNIKFPASWIYDVEDEYKPSNDIFNEDDIIIDKIKRIIQNDLNDTERRIIICYAHLGNIRETAKLFKVSPTTIWTKIKEIKIKIIKKL